MSKELDKSILKVKRSIERKASKDMKPILSAYKRSLTRTQGQIAQFVSKYTVDGKLSVSDAKRYSTLVNLEQSIIKQARDIGNLELKATTEILTDSYKSSYYQSFYHLDQGVDIGARFSLLRPEFVERAVNIPLQGANFSDRIWKNKEDMINRLRGTLERTMIDGVDPARLAREISKDFGTSAYESSRLVQTETARATSQASMQVYEDSGVVAKILFNATLDGDTSETCEELDGKEFDLGSEPEVPQHPNCRSVLIPMIEGWNPTKRKDNATGEVEDYKTYKDWAKSKGIS